ncbi:hypothetical protein FOC4_g10012349 [Fusarium odoratissimum]|uniref:Major facilitator superfamily (MFS) profile domain-containing protein n=1 Tax=Fusarium oxysporum f. sp. cubense (strain race 4) TaxID=2502994 RepID=N1RMV3_FUSC4|nr:hypothetical protein FOC4_g10012349 [Fusarium odoratissimum]
MSRSRTGCSTCKRRHRKCDETKPTCLECQKNNLTCEGYALKLQWDVGVASRGKLTGASLPVLGAGNERKRERGLEIDGAEGSFGQFQALPLGQVEASGLGSEVLMDMEYPVIETEEPQWLQRRSDQEKQLFKECKPPTNQVIQKTVFLFYSTSTEDPFPLELQRLALQNEPLYLGLIATHVYNTNPRNPPPLFHDLCNQSLRLFREQLSRFDGTLDGGLINAGVFLCTLHNWSKRRKAWNFTLVLAVTVAFFSAIVMQMVLWQQMIIDMHVTYDQLNYGVAFNSAGLALGSFLFIPLARKYGSRPCYILSTGLMAAVSWWSGRMETVGEMYVTNFLSGLAASINETISEITIADLFFVHQRGTANGFYIMAVMVGQFVCPCIVGVQAAAQGWRWTYYTTGIVLTVLFLLFIFFFEETKFIPVTIGETRNTSGQGTPTLKNPKDDSTQADIQDSDLNSETHPPRLTYKQRMRFITRTDEPLWRNYLVPLKMFLFPHVLFSALQVASCVAFLILLTSSISMIFSAPPYNFNTAGVGLMSLGPFVGNFLGSVYGGVLGDWVVVKLAKRNKGIFEPEMRLYILLLPALLTGGGLVFFGISADKGWHWIYPSIGGAMFGFGMASMIDISCTIVIDIYQTLTAEAFISVTFIRNIPSIGVPFGVVGWISSIGISKLFIISGCVATLVCLLFIPCAIWGRRVRENTWQMYQSVRELKGAARH